ncbi:glycosyltransferase, partial [Balneolaceae bacterium ANBcel3]|nr:glycosyltransferase [Balneolaceae bacterium ANBcel3]
KSSYPKIVQILVADGRSTDRTADIVHELSLEDKRIELVDNPDRLQAAGLNRLITMAEGELFLRADAHCEYASDYVEEAVEAYITSGALNVGGHQRFVAKNNVQAYIALAVDSFLGSGGALYRDVSYRGYADTVFLGCFDTVTLKKINGFIEDSVTNEDAELNIRLEKLKKNAVYISPGIKVWYYPRKDIKSLFKQYYRYGKGRFLTVIRHDSRKSFRGSTPFIAIILLLFLFTFLFLINKALWVIAILFILLTIVLLSVVRTVKRNFATFETHIWRSGKDTVPGVFKRIIGTFLVIVTMNVAHFCGFGVQLLKSLAGKKSW